ncbi:hypothetical protein C8J56DRAFT_1160439 [Mycena floridula]|nr:hypothetical protein C8J56DRAFT_1160439 [Mycena floridula]
MTSQLDTFPDIPDDVIHLIFEAAVQEDRSAALNLVLLARHVQKWIQPLQFKAVRLRDEQGAETFLQEVTSNPTRLGIHVQTMTLVLGDLRPGLLKAIVNSLPHLSTLSIWIPTEEIRSFFSPRLPSLKRMCLLLGYKWDFDRHETLNLHKDIIPFLPESLTHLEFDSGADFPLFPDEGLRHLTRLTHLIVRYNWVVNGDICIFVEELLLHLPNSLQRIIIIIVNMNPLVSWFQRIPGLTCSWIIKQCDPRVVIVMEHPETEVPTSIDDWDDDRIKECILLDRLPEPAGHWCSSPSWHKDIWDRAAEMQEKSPVPFELSTEGWLQPVGHDEPYARAFGADASFLGILPTDGQRLVGAPPQTLEELSA